MTAQATQIWKALEATWSVDINIPQVVAQIMDIHTAFSSKRSQTLAQIPALVGSWAQTSPSVAACAQPRYHIALSGSMCPAQVSHCPSWQHVSTPSSLLLTTLVSFYFCPHCMRHFSSSPISPPHTSSSWWHLPVQAIGHGQVFSHAFMCTTTHHTSFLLSLGRALHFSSYPTATWAALSATMLVS